MPLIEQAIKAILEKTGIELFAVPRPLYDGGTIDMIVKDRKLSFQVEVKNYVGAYHVDKIAKEGKSHPVMIIAEQIAPPARELLRKKGIAYLEANGNMFIDTDTTTIFIDGNKPVKEIRPVTNRAFTKTGLKVVFHILNNPEAITGTYRQLAMETAVGLGNITYIMGGLEEAGFILPIDKRKVMLKNKKVLLERWLAGYRETLKPDLLKGTFRMWNVNKRNNWQDIDIRALDAQWGGEAAGEIMTDYLQAEKLTIHTDSLQVVTALSLIPNEDGDVQLYERFWHQSGDAQITAPPLLVYADLLVTDDPRCIETANLIYEKYLKGNIETD